MTPRWPLPDRLLVVTDRHQAVRPLIEIVGAAFASGARWVWLRDKDLPATERRALGRDLAALARQYAATLSVGGDVALAADLGVGVHLGAEADVAAARRALGPNAVIGVSAHDLGDSSDAREAGADYATLSPIFLSSSKPDYGPALGLDTLNEAAGLGLPILALGGISQANARLCLEAGAAGVAVMGTAMRDDGTHVRSLRQILSVDRA